MKNPLSTVSNAARLGAFSFLLFAVLLMGYLYESYLEGYKGAVKESQNYAWALSEQARSTFESADNDLVELDEHLTESDFTSGKNGIDQARAEKIHNIIKVRMSRLKMLGAINIHDSHGDLLYSSKEPFPVVNNADRPYFQEIKAHPELERVFSEPLISRSTGKPTIIMARRFLSNDGKFIGTIQANVELDRFISVYQSLNLGKGSVVSMRTVNGFHRMARHPTPSEGQEPVTKSLVHPLKAFLDKNLTKGTLDVTSPTDGAVRTVSFQKIGNYPFYVEVGFAVDDYEMGWKIRAILLSLAQMAYGGIAFVFVRDVTESKVKEQKSRHIAHHDNLTGLPNRAFFLNHIEHAVLRAKSNRHKMAVLFLDLDGFKHVNDTLGHDAGDLLLKEVAIRLNGVIRNSDTVARMGGDEFTFVLNEIGDDENASSVARKIIAVLSVPFDLKGQQCRVGGSIGIAVYPADSTDFETLLKQADEAMYLAKQSGKNTYRFHRDINENRA